MLTLGLVWGSAWRMVELVELLADPRYVDKLGDFSVDDGSLRTGGLVN